MAVTSYDMALDALLKEYYPKSIQEQLNNKTLLLKRVQKNTEDFEGRRGIVPLHIDRNVPYARAAGIKLGPRGKQTDISTYIDMARNYIRGYVDGDSISRTKGKKGAFVKIVDHEITGAKNDLLNDMNRQLFSDGSGILALNSVADATSPNVVYPYLWAPATKYLGTDNMLTQTVDAATLATLDPATSDTDTDALSVVGASITGTSFAWDSGTYATATEGDPIGKWRSLFYFASNAVKKYEMEGLWGAIHDSNLIGASDYYYDRTNSGTNFVGPEGQNYDFTIASNVHSFQSVSAETYSIWRSLCYGFAGVPRAITDTLLDQMWGELTVTRGASPSFIITTVGVVNKIKQLWKADRRFVNEKVLDGFAGIEYNGIPIVADKDCPRGTMFFVDESTFSYYEMEPIKFIEDTGGKVLHWITDYDAFEFCLYTKSNLACHSRYKNGKIFDIAE